MNDPKNRKRILGFIAVAAFVAGGFLLFGPKIPQEVTLRFDLPPTVRHQLVEIPRARVVLLTATIADLEGNTVATLNLPSPRGLEGPRTSPVALRLKRGSYVVRAKARSILAQEVPLEGNLVAEGDEVIVELK